MARRHKSKPKSRRIDEIVVTIDRLGRQGDGLARHGDHSVYVPLSVPGERWRVGVSAADTDMVAIPVELIEAGADRIDPPCPHFGQCGGCRVQQLAAQPYLDWKRGLVVGSLATVGLEPDVVDGLVAIPSGTRRRVTFAARRTRDGVVFGRNARRSSEIVALQHCVIARPEIVGLMEPLRNLLSALLKPGLMIDVAVTVLDDGIDLVLIGGESPDLAGREHLAAFAETHDLARISWREKAGRPVEPIAHRRAGVLWTGDVSVVLPPGGFCQASTEGETILAELVLGAVGSRQSIADLFCGIGTFGLRLAFGGRRVLGVDGDAEAIGAFENAARQHPISNRPVGRTGDLFRNPMAASDLNGFDAVVFDPPRAGAKTQAFELAASTVERVVGVSCSPASFARDARILVDGGYRLERVTPVDQFIWSSHTELVGVFSR